MRDGHGKGTDMSSRGSRLQGRADGAAVKDRTAARVAWSVWAASCVVFVLAVVLSIQVETAAFSLSFGAVLAAFATVGAVVAARHSHNAVDGCVSPSDLLAV
jgi:Trk-type K+ transport system membrane component